MGDLQSGACVPLLQFSILEQPAVCVFSNVRTIRAEPFARVDSF
jgi:hypothetical protein